MFNKFPEKKYFIKDFMFTKYFNNPLLNVDFSTLKSKSMLIHSFTGKHTTYINVTHNNSFLLA